METLGVEVLFEGAPDWRAEPGGSGGLLWPPICSGLTQGSAVIPAIPACFGERKEERGDMWGPQSVPREESCVAEAGCARESGNGPGEAVSAQVLR